MFSIFQNDGTRPPVTVDDQPDLLNITKTYIGAGGDFWIATDDGKLAGTIGIMPCGDGVAVLKKFFVYEKYQGEPHHLGRQLYSHLLEFAKKNNIKTVMLDTPHNTVRAHKFYEKAGFKKSASPNCRCISATHIKAAISSCSICNRGD